MFFFTQSLHGKPNFLFPDVLERWSFQKNRAGIWSFSYYWERSCFSFSKYDLNLRRKMKDDLFQKNTRKYDIFFKPPEKKVFSRKAASGHDLFCIIWKDGFFFPKTRYFFLGRKPATTFSRNTCKYFLCTCVGITGLVSRLPAKKNQGWPYPAKIHLKVIDVLDWHPEKSSSKSL